MADIHKNSKKSSIYYFGIFVFSIMFQSALFAKDNPENILPLSTVIEKIINHYPSLDVAAIEIQRARQEFAKVESQLGWVLSANAGLSRDVSIIDSPTDHYEAGVGIGRKFKSGSSLELSGIYAHDDSDIGFSSALPNPSERTRVDLKYRIPLGQGDNNPEYMAGLIGAKSGILIQESNQRYIIDNLMQQSMTLYYDILLTHVRIEDAKTGIQRAKRLLGFIDRNRNLGLSEKKDILRVQSQLQKQIAQHDSLKVIWHQQRSELNRLMGEPSEREFIPSADHDAKVNLTDYESSLERVYQRDPELNLQKGQLQLAEAEITLARDEKRDKFDLIVSVGNRNVSGETVAGSVDNNEVVGGALLEYRYTVDKKGFDAGLYQAMLQKEQAQKEIDRIKSDLQHQLKSLFLQAEANKRAVDSNLAHYKVEKEKIEEAFKRYKEGRASTNELIDFEESLQSSYLLHQNQKILLSRNIANITLLMGTLWDDSSINRRINSLSNKREQQ